MNRISITALAALTVWVGLVLMGYQGIQGVVAQHAPGYPNAGQIRFYIAFPAVVATAVLLSGICLWFGRLRIVARAVQVLSFVVLFPYLLAYTGGV